MSRFQIVDMEQIVLCMDINLIFFIAVWVLPRLIFVSCANLHKNFDGLVNNLSEILRSFSSDRTLGLPLLGAPATEPLFWNLSNAAQCHPWGLTVFGNFPLNVSFMKGVELLCIYLPLEKNSQPKTYVLQWLAYWQSGYEH